MRSLRIRTIFFFLPAMLLSLPAAGFVTITKVADTNTLMPESQIKFLDFRYLGLSAGEVAFNGVGATRSGVYKWSDGTLIKVADTNSDPPGSTAPYSGFSQVDVDLGRVIFRGFLGTDQVSAGQGVYVWDAGTLTKIVDTSTLAPGSSETFAGFGTIFLEGDSAWFYGRHPVSPTSEQGFYRAQGSTISRIIGAGMESSGQPVNLYSSPVSVNLGRVAAYGTIGALFKVVIWQDGEYETVVTANDAIPGHAPVTFTLDTMNGAIAFDDSNVAFLTDYGVFGRIQGSLQKVAGYITPVSDQVGVLSNIRIYLAMDDGKVAFVADYALGTETGIFLWENNQVRMLTSSETPFDNSTFTDFRFRNNCFDDGRLAFLGTLADGRKGVYFLSETAAPEGVTISAQQSMRISGSGGYQVLVYNYNTSTLQLTSPYATAPSSFEYNLPKNEWLGVYVYDYTAAAFTEGHYQTTDDL